MKSRYFYIIILFFSFWPAESYSQKINCVTDPPLPPVLTTVSVQPETGNTNFTWTLSPSQDIAAYIVYSYNNGDGLALDTIWNPAATSYTLSSTATKYLSVSYVISAMRLPTCTSIFSNVINSIFEKTSVDTCLKKITVSWNSYPSYPIKVTGYTILSSVAGGTFIETANAGTAETSAIFTDFTINSDYCYVVRANLEDGRFSTSNKTCLSTKMQRLPLWINADEATFNPDGKIALSFTIDPFSEIKHFSLERRNGKSGDFKEIAQPLSTNGFVQYIDNQIDLKTIYYYRLSAVNNCNLPVISSNIASDMILNLVKTGDNIILSWNPYEKWLGTVSSYKLFANTGKGFEEKADISSSDTTFTLGYQQIMYQVSGNEVCFYISASESSNPYNISGESISSEICTNPAEIITVPNVFTPNNDLKNDQFKPVLSFTPRDYQLIITDGHSKVLFDSRDFQETWNGTSNGSPEPQGVYLWFLKLTTPSGKIIKRTGTITIISNK